MGRIGRNVLKQLIDNEQLELVADNDLTEPSTLAHLIKYDSIYGIYTKEITADDKNIIINQKRIPVFSEKDPALLPWASLRVDCVIEATGKFTKAEAATAHITAGAKKVIISAPATGELKTIVISVNDQLIKGDEKIISNASCTTNNAAPMIKIIDDNFKIESAYII